MGKKYLGAAVVASNDLLFIAQLYHHGYHSGLACDVVSVKLRKCYLTSLGNFLRLGFSKTFSRNFYFLWWKHQELSFSHVLARWSLLFLLETRLLLFVVVPFVVHVSKSFQKRVITLSPCMFPEFRDMYCFKDLRHKSYHTSPLPNCFSSCLSNKYSQLLTHQTNTRTEKSPTRIADSGVHHCSILVAAMGRICDLSFAVILVFCLTKGTSSNQGKPYHWLLVFVIISTRHRGEI